jgi:hypothetical protein
MGKRGPKAKGSTSLVMMGETDRAIIYPDAPYNLSEAETDIWNAVVQDCSPDWFSPRNTAILTQYCRHVARANRIARMIQIYETELDRKASGQATTIPCDATDYRELLKMQRSETGMIATLATKMRISHQSTKSHDDTPMKADEKPRTPLWEIGNNYDKASA